MKFIKEFWYFLFPPDDWKVVWSANAYFDTSTYYADIKYTLDNRNDCFYIIKYSKYRGKYSLSCRGYKPTEHQYYQVALNKLIELSK